MNENEMKIHTKNRMSLNQWKRQESDKNIEIVTKEWELRCDGLRMKNDYKLDFQNFEKNNSTI